MPLKTMTRTNIASAGSNVMRRLSEGFCGMSGGSNTEMASLDKVSFMRVLRLNFGYSSADMDSATLSDVTLVFEISSLFV